MNNVEGISLREVFEYALQRKVKENNQTTNTEVRIQSETLFHGKYLKFLKILNYFIKKRYGISA